MYDLLLKAGTVVDAANGPGGVLEQRLGRLEVGRQADVSVLELRQGVWMLHDILGSGLRVDRAFLPHLTVKRGAVSAPDFGPPPWGWEPDRVLPKGPIAGGCC